jgi:hypothetical protein
VPRTDCQIQELPSAKYIEEDSDSSQFGWEDYMANYFQDRWKCKFSSRISSQPLLYRLCALFGMPPQIDTVRHWGCWRANLQHSRGSIIMFEDFKGQASLTFRGSFGCTDDALELINFLISLICLHPYQNIIARKMA